MDAQGLTLRPAYTLAELIRLRAQECRGTTAILDGSEVTSYADLHLRSNRVAQALLGEGAGPGTRIAFLARSRTECFEVLLGTAKIGAVLVPINWRLAPGEVRFLLADSEAKVLIVATDLLEDLPVPLDRADELTKVVVLENHAQLQDYESWLSNFAATDPSWTSTPQDVAVQMYTSGTTGIPKGVLLTNRNLLCVCVEAPGAYGICQKSVNLVSSPLFHISGLGWAVTAFYHGCTAVLARDVSAQSLLEQIPRDGVTHALFVPALLRDLVLTPGVQEADFSRLEAVLYGASPISVDVLERSIALLGCQFFGAYGLTETAGEVTVLPAEDHELGALDHCRLLSVGRPLPWVRLRIVDPHSGLDVQPGTSGEICVRSAQVTPGYWQRPEETSAAIDAQGWLHTGDAGRVDEDGYVYLQDRLKDVVISGGENVYPAEVENALMSHSDVVDVAVFGVPHDRWGETVKAAVVRRSGSKPSAAELIQYTRGRLAHYKCPTSIDFFDQLPRTSSGKLNKRELREPYWLDHERRVN